MPCKVKPRKKEVHLKIRRGGLGKKGIRQRRWGLYLKAEINMFRGY